MKKHLSPLLFGIGTFLIIFSVLIDDLVAYFAVNTLGEALRKRGTEHSDSK